MSSNADHNYELIEFVAEGLGEAFLAEVAFVGGCTTAMLVTDTAVLDDIRFTDDVDLVIELAGISAWNQLTERLAAKGPPPLGRATVSADHLGVGPGLVDEDQPVRIDPGLERAPALAPPYNIRTQPLIGDGGFF